VDLADESRETVLTVLVKPALRSAESDPLLPSDPRKRHTVLKVQAQELETLKGTCAGLLRELRQGGRSAILEPPRLINMSQKRRSLLKTPTRGRGLVAQFCHLLALPLSA
jgi:hypothetical protein